jgi:hypothetical protein
MPSATLPGRKLKALQVASGATASIVILQRRGAVVLIVPSKRRIAGRVALLAENSDEVTNPPVRES